MITRILRSSDHKEFLGPVQKFLCRLFNTQFSPEKFICYMEVYYNIRVSKEFSQELTNKTKDEVLDQLASLNLPNRG